MDRKRVAVTPPLTPIEEERANGLVSPLQPLAWKCCHCNLLNYFFDDNYAWFNNIAEYCIKLDCLHQRCSRCSDPGPAHWPIQYADGRPIQHLFEELQQSMEDKDDNSDIVIESDRESSSTSFAESMMDVSSDEEHWQSILENAPIPSFGALGDTPETRHPCPLRETHLCPARFESEEAAWQHSSTHAGQEVIPCSLSNCQMTFSGKEAMRLHYIAMHS